MAFWWATSRGAIPKQHTADPVPRIGHCLNSVLLMDAPLNVGIRAVEG